MSKVVFVLGLQGVGKSRYIEDSYPDASCVVDFEDYWQGAPPEMDDYEKATWVKCMSAVTLAYHLEDNEKLIIVECTGLTRVNQAAIHAMMVECRIHEYKMELVYLKPVDPGTFQDTLQDNPGGLSMLYAYRSGGPQWREPYQCPYFPKGKKVLVDHSSWGKLDEPQVYKVERES